MESARTFSSGQRTLLSLAALVVLLAGMKAADALVAPALLAIVIAMAVVPVQHWLSQRIGRVSAYLLTLAGVLAAILGVTAVLGFGLASLVAELASLTGRTDDLYREGLRLIAGAGIEPGRVAGAVEGQQVESSQALLRLAGEAVGILADFGLVIFLALFMLADATRLSEKADALKKYEGVAVVERFGELSNDIRSYLRINAIVGVTSGTLITGLLLVLGIPLAPLWGLLVALLKFVPAFGFWIAVIPPILLAAFSKGLTLALGVGIGAFVLNQAVEHILKPRLVSTGLRLSAFTLIFSLVFWTFILGPLGVILAVPLTLAVRALLVEPSNQLEWLSVLMATRVEKPSAGARPHAAKDAD